ncbi:MAG TPA: hypothetical protein V6D06_07435 [Trichocoleus sp.]
MGQFSPSHLKSWLGVFRQPGYVAALASVGVHGILFGAGPSFSSLDLGTLTGAGAPGEERRVPVIELTPEEQSRLPDFSASPYSLLPDTGSVPFDLLPVPNSSSPSPPAASALPPSLSPNPFAIGINPYIPPSRPSVVIPPRRTTLPPTTRLPGGTRSNLGQPRPNQPARPDNSASTATSSTSGASTTTTEAQPRPTQPGASELLEGGPIATGPRASNGGSPAQPQGQNQGQQGNSNLQEQLQALAYSPTGTTDEEAAAARQGWLETVQKEASAPDLEVGEAIELPVTYEGRICLSPEPVDGLIGVWVKPDGTLGGDPALLKSTGYGSLNEQAASAIAEFNFPTTDAPAAYEFDINVNYNSESCVDREQLLKSRQADQQ